MKVIKDNPGCKLLVYAGLDHIHKANAREKKMAQYLSELTGENILSISQSDIIGTPDEALTLIPEKYLSHVINPGSIDLYIVNNLKPSLNNIFAANKLSELKIKDKKLKKYNGRDVLVSVYFADEFKKHSLRAIPIINTINKPQAGTVNTSLPCGHFYVVIRSEENEVINIREVNTKNI